MIRSKISTLLLVILGMGNVAKAQTYDTLSDFGDYWKYSDKTKLDSIDWKPISYNDGSWSCGPAPLGYGDAWMSTCISCGCATEYNCSHPSTCSVNATDYFRKKIKLLNTKLYDSVRIEGIIDDGVMLYVNGIQVWSYGLTSPVTYSTWSTNNISGAAETTPVNTVIGIDAFVNGDNQISAELHQRAANTSDATFDLRFMFFKHQVVTTGLNVISPNEKLLIYPNPTNSDFTIENKFGFNNSYELSFYDISGRLLSQKMGEFTNGKSIVKHNLENGIYMVQLKSETINSTFKLQIIK